MIAQLALFDLRDEGMGLAASAQDRTCAGWSRQALSAIVLVALRQPTVHVDDVARESEDWLSEPSHPNAWGAVWMKAINEGVIRRTGEVQPAGGTYKPHAHKHGRAYPVYQSLIHRGRE